MNPISQILESLNFELIDGNHTTVHSWWKEVVDLFQYTRIYYITFGRAQLMMSGGPLELTEGNLYLIPPSSVQSGDCPDTMDHYYIHLRTDALTTSILSAMPFPLCVPAPGYAKDLFELALYNMNNMEQPYPKVLAKHATKLLLLLFFENIQSERLSPHISRFTPIIEYINDHIKEKITVKELADLIHLNEIYFSSLFTKTFGTSPQNYILNKKINLSCIALSNDDLTVKEVAYALNFYDEAYFSRIFKKKTGLTPTEFRNNIK